MRHTSRLMTFIFFFFFFGRQKLFDAESGDFWRLHRPLLATCGPNYLVTLSRSALKGLTRAHCTFSELAFFCIQTSNKSCSIAYETFSIWRPHTRLYSTRHRQPSLQIAAKTAPEMPRPTYSCRWTLLPRAYASRRSTPHLWPRGQIPSCVHCVRVIEIQGLRRLNF